MRMLARVAALGVLLNVVFPAAVLVGLMGQARQAEAQSPLASVGVLPVGVGLGLLTLLGGAGGLLLLLPRRAGLISGVLFLCLWSAYVVVSSVILPIPNALFPLWLSIPPLAALLVPGVVRACR
jgi:hypothetical protein